jgi:hypothetical protein
MQASIDCPAGCRLKPRGVFLALRWLIEAVYRDGLDQLGT